MLLFLSCLAAQVIFVQKLYPLPRSPCRQRRSKISIPSSSASPRHRRSATATPTGSPSSSRRARTARFVPSFEPHVLYADIECQMVDIDKKKFLVPGDLTGLAAVGFSQRPLTLHCCSRAVLLRRPQAHQAHAGAGTLDLC